MNLIKKDCSIFALGGIAYGLIEILWRGRTHWSMIVTGGTCLVSLYKIYNNMKHPTLLKKCLVGSGVITAYEFVAGCVFNLWLKLDVWDYSHMPFNIKGQVCLLYSVLWALLCIPISLLCKVIRD